MNLQLLTGVIIFSPGGFVVLLLAWVGLSLLTLLEDYKEKKMGLEKRINDIIEEGKKRKP